MESPEIAFQFGHSHTTSTFIPRHSIRVFEPVWSYRIVRDVPDSTLRVHLYVCQPPFAGKGSQWAPGGSCQASRSCYERGGILAHEILVCQTVSPTTDLKLRPNTGLASYDCTRVCTRCEGRVPSETGYSSPYFALPGVVPGRGKHAVEMFVTCVTLDSVGYDPRGCLRCDIESWCAP